MLHRPTAGQRSAGRPSAFQPAARATTRTLETISDASGHTTSVVRRTQLPSGLRIITEQMAGARSAAIGVWVGVGSRDERATTHGASHFLEHLLFKGTRERSALDISIALDAVVVSSTPSPPRSTPASTPACSPRTCRWPSTCWAT